jgi:plastocyanin
MRAYILLIFTALVVAGCAGDTDESSGDGSTTTPTGSGQTTTTPSTTTPAAGDAGQARTVDISNFAFQPGTLELGVGDTVRWTNKDRSTHTATADDGEFDSGNLARDQTFEHTFDAAGTYAYHCNIHTGMKGTIRVS